ncbi:hypothetical protein L3Q82_019734, partial [Scortum barcoo]
MSYLLSAFGITLGDKVRSSDKWKELRVGILPTAALHAKSGRIQPGEDPGEDPEQTGWTTYICNLSWETLGIPQADLEDIAIRKIPSDT